MGQKMINTNNNAGSTPKATLNGFRQRYMEHFSRSTTATDVYVRTLVEDMYPNRTVVAVSDTCSFQLKHYMDSAHDEELIVTDGEEMKKMGTVSFRRPCHWRHGSGTLRETPELAHWKLTWRGQNDEGNGTNIVFIVCDDEDHAHDFILTVMQFCCRSEEVPFHVFQHGCWHSDQLMWQDIKQASWDSVVMSDDMKRALKRDYQSFFKSEQTYKRLGVPWKRGLILHGPPGNGKTITLKTIMGSIDGHVLYVRGIRREHVCDEDMIAEIFRKARSRAPCLLILEDLDSMITDKNRSCFLNEVDGMKGNDGILIIGTTNHLDRLDPALSSRPSRFDRKYLFPDPNEAQRRHYAAFWQDKLKDTPAIEFPDSLLDVFASGTEGYSYAYMKEAFVSAMIAMAQNEEEKAMEANGAEAEPSLTFAEALTGQLEHLRKEMKEVKKAAGEEEGSEDGRSEDKDNSGSEDTDGSNSKDSDDDE